MHRRGALTEVHKVAGVLSLVVRLWRMHARRVREKCHLELPG